MPFHLLLAPLGHVGGRAHRMGGSLSRAVLTSSLSNVPLSSGSYGGIGGYGAGMSPPSSTYGAISTPSACGSDGGIGKVGAIPGRGGGVVWLEVGGQLTIDGELTADGTDATAGSAAGGGRYGTCVSLE